MKKIISLLVAALLAVSCFAFAGCTQQPADGADQPGQSGGADQPEQSGDTLKIGMLAPLTGEVAEYGVAVANGVRLYVKEYNAAGGMNGTPIELVEYDEEGDPAKAVTGYNSLVDQGVAAIIGDVTTGPTVAVVVESQADNMPMITASATAAAVTVDPDTGAVYENMFRSCFIDPFQGEKMATFAFDELGAKTAAILYNTGIDYSVGLTDAFREKAAELGLEIVAEESYADGAVDFMSQLTTIAAAAPDVLFVPDYYSVVALVATQADAAGVTATLLGADGWDTVLQVVEDASLLEGAYYCAGYSKNDETEAVQNFIAAYEAEYGSAPNMFAAQAYDAAAILFAALEKVDGSLTVGSDEYKQAVIDALNATDMECVTGHVTYDELNNPEKTAAIIQIKDGVESFWGKY